MSIPFLPDLHLMETEWTQRGNDLLATVDRVRSQLTSLDWRSPAATAAAEVAHASLVAARQSGLTCLSVADALHKHRHRADQMIAAAQGVLRAGLGQVSREISLLGRLR